MEQRDIKILVVEDEALIAMNISTVLEKLGYYVLGPALDGEEALSIIKETNPDLVISDINLGHGKMSGIDIGTYLKDNHQVPIIYLTAYNDTSTIHKAMTTNPSAYLIKPFTEESLYASIQIAINYFSTVQDSNLKPEEVEEDKINYFYIKLGNQFNKLVYEDISYIIFEDRYSILFDKNLKKIPIRSSLNHLEDKLRKFNFIRISKKAIV